MGETAGNQVPSHQGASGGNASGQQPGVTQRAASLRKSSVAACAAAGSRSVRSATTLAKHNVDQRAPAKEQVHGNNARQG